MISDQRTGYSWITQEFFAATQDLYQGGVFLLPLVEAPESASPVPQGEAPPVTQFQLRGIRGTIGVEAFDSAEYSSAQSLILFMGIYLAQWDATVGQYVVLDPANPAEVNRGDWLWYKATILDRSEMVAPDVLSPVLNQEIDLECNLRIVLGEALVFVYNIQGGLSADGYLTPMLRLKVGNYD